MTVYLDANCVIYLVERNPVWYPKVVSRLGALQAASETLAVSDAALAEALVLPFRLGNATLEATYRAFFADPSFTSLPITRAVWERAARLRAAHPSFKLPDALHLAIAIENGCGLFLTADARLAKCTDITVEVLT